MEIDVASGCWQQHGHHTNTAFSGVGLHVVWQAGNGVPTGLPVVELKDQLDAPVGELSQALGQADETVALLARLLGVGGLLPDQLDRDKLTNRYLRTLWDQWWRDRDRLAKRIQPRDVWTFHGPVSYTHLTLPTKRIV